MEDSITKSGEDAVASLCLLGRSIIVTKRNLESDVNLDALMLEIHKTGLESMKVGISDASKHLCSIFFMKSVQIGEIQWRRIQQYGSFQIQRFTEAMPIHNSALSVF